MLPLELPRELRTWLDFSQWLDWLDKRFGFTCKPYQGLLLGGHDSEGYPDAQSFGVGDWYKGKPYYE